MKARIVTVFGTLLLLLLLFTSQDHPSLKPLKQGLQKKTVPAAILARGSMGKALRELDLLKPVPNDYTQYKHYSLSYFEERRRQFQNRSRTHIQAYGLRDQLKFSSPSLSSVSQSIIDSGVSILSIAIDEYDLNDPVIGLFQHPFGKGRNWERPAFITYFNEGAEQFTTAVGLRIHGRGSRWNKHKSLRLYFRKAYGISNFPEKHLFEGTRTSRKTVAVLNHFRFNKFFISPLAYDIAREIGATAPRTEPVRVFLNGEDWGLYFFTERWDEEKKLATFGHNDFEEYDTRGDEPMPEAYRQLHLWSGSPEIPLDEVKNQVDYENLLSWYALILFCGTEDAFQGTILKSLRENQARWFWLVWDMDVSFPGDNPATHDTYKYLMEAHATVHGDKDVRAHLFPKLVKDSQFQRDLTTLLVHNLNHKLTNSYLNELHEKYSWVGLRFRQNVADEMEFYRRFFSHRKEHLLSLTGKYLKQGKHFKVAVQGVEQHQILIDGVFERLPYAGHYFKNTPISLQIPDSRKSHFSHWLVDDGSKITTASVSLTPERNLTITPVFTAFP